MTEASHSHVHVEATDALRRSLRAVAVFEAIKGIAVLAASAGLLGLMHRDMHRMAIDLLAHLGLAPGAPYPSMLVHYADVLNNTSLRLLLLAGASYVTIRLAEAYGLWQDRAWAEWLGALSGALYLPFELHHLLHRPGFASAAVLLLNLLVVTFLGVRLRRRRAARL